MVMFDLLVERLRERDEWRCATMEYGGQCVLMDGMKWQQMLSVVNFSVMSSPVREMHNNYNNTVIFNHSLCTFCTL